MCVCVCVIHNYHVDYILIALQIPSTCNNY